MQHNHFYKGTAYIWRATLEDMNSIIVSSASHAQTSVRKKNWNFQWD